MNVRICPTCGRVNPATKAVCENEDCAEGLLNEPIIDSATSSTETSSTDMPSTETTSEHDPVSVGNNRANNRGGSGLPPSKQDSSVPTGPMRKCNHCGKVMPYSFSQCVCGSPLFGPPIAGSQDGVSSASNPLSFHLRSEDGRCRLELKKDADITLGRTADGSEYLAGKAYVSREHVRITYRDGNIVLYSVSQTNPTLVNGKAISQNKPFPLNDRDLIALGAQPGQNAEPNAAYFRLMKET